MTAVTALNAFTAIESDIAIKAIAWGRALTCAIAIRTDNAMLGIVYLHSSITGVITFTGIDGIAVSRERFMEIYVTPYAQRLDAIHRARNDARAAIETISNYTRSRRKHFQVEAGNTTISLANAPIRHDRPPVATTHACCIRVVAMDMAGRSNIRHDRRIIPACAACFSLATLKSAMPPRIMKLPLRNFAA